MKPYFRIIDSNYALGLVWRSIREFRKLNFYGIGLEKITELKRTNINFIFGQGLD